MGVECGSCMRCFQGGWESQARKPEVSLCSKDLAYLKDCQSFGSHCSIGVCALIPFLSPSSVISVGGESGVTLLKVQILALLLSCVKILGKNLTSVPWFLYALNATIISRWSSCSCPCSVRSILYITVRMSFYKRMIDHVTPVFKSFQRLPIPWNKSQSPYTALARSGPYPSPITLPLTVVQNHPEVLLK